LDHRWGWAALEASLLLLSAVTLAGSIVVIVLASYCCSMFRDVRDAQEEFRHQIQQFYHAALSAKGLGHDETSGVFIATASRFGAFWKKSRTDR